MLVSYIQTICPVQSKGVNLETHFTGTRLGFFHILDRKHFRSAELIETNNTCSFHSLLLPVALRPQLPGVIAVQFQIICQHNAVS